MSLSSLLFDFFSSAGNWSQGFGFPAIPFYQGPLEWVSMNSKAFAQTHKEHVQPAAQGLRKNMDKGAGIHQQIVTEAVNLAGLVKKVEAFPFPPADQATADQVHSLLGEVSASHKRISALLSEQISVAEAIIKDQTVLVTALEKQQEHLTK